MDPLSLLPVDPAAEAAAAAAAAAVVQSLTDMGADVFFEKQLTSSDASGSGRVVIPKLIAEQYFPRLECQSGVSVRAIDTKGNSYSFKFRFWINNQSRMYLLEGAGALHQSYGIHVGDVMMFAQRKADGTLVVAGRPSTSADMLKRPPIKRPNGSGSQPSSSGQRSRDGRRGGRPPSGKRGRRGPNYAVPGLDVEPPPDGIFRPVRNKAFEMPVGVHQSSLTGRWVATLDLCGELYSAVLELREDAVEALRASGSLAVAAAAAAAAAAPAAATADGAGPTQQPALQLDAAAA